MSLDVALLRHRCLLHCGPAERGDCLWVVARGLWKLHREMSGFTGADEANRPSSNGREQHNNAELQRRKRRKKPFEMNT